MFPKPYPIDQIRAQFPSLQRIYKGNQVVYLDGPAGTQIVQASIDALVNYVHQGRSNTHGCYPTGRETDAILDHARAAIADLVGALPEEVAFGPNTTTLIFSVSRALGRNINPGDEIVVTELDHRANVDPWIAMAADRGATIRWIKLNLDTFELELDNLPEIINSNTKIVAVGLGSNGVGTITDVARISARAREVNALIVVDAVHAVPHIAVDRDKLGADVIFCSAYKFFGPFIGAAIIQKNIFEHLLPYKVKPSPDNIPDNLETGTQNHEGLAGIPAVIEFIASLGLGNTRREKLISAMELLESYENHLADRIRVAFRQIPEIILYQAPDPTRKTSTIAFNIENQSPQKVCEILSEKYGIFAGDGHFYAMTIGDLLGINSTGGWIRLGMAPYTTESEVDRVINAIKEIIHNTLI
ncbi:MAG: cysteine desulfurase-like protein [Promethearchaeota archaeon]|nr:MAG: cysteine desulfurase-like protein [Candidatus Lokiarchaeota archaeon]